MGWLRKFALEAVGHARIDVMQKMGLSRVQATVTDSHFLIPLGVFFVGLVLLVMLH
jgi:hypothetical protein